MPGFLSSGQANANSGGSPAVSDDTIGLPTDGSYADGSVSINSTDTIADAVDALNEYILSLNASASPSTIDITCDSGIVIGDLVYVNASGVGQKAIATSSATARVVGFVVAKPASTTARVSTFGVANISGVSIGTKYYLSETVAGGLQSAIPTTSGYVMLYVGTGLSSSTVLFDTKSHLPITRS